MDLPALLAGAMDVTDTVAGLILTVIFLGIVCTSALALKADTLIVMVLAVATTAVLYAIEWAPLWLLFVEFIGLVILLAMTVSGSGGKE